MDRRVDQSHSIDLEYVAISAGGQRFCIDIQHVMELRRWSPVTALPHSGDDVLGVINLRGAVIPIVDLAARFGLPPINRHDRNVIVIVRQKGSTLGLVVDAVSEILSVPAAKIQDTPDVQSDVTRRSIVGVFEADGDIVRILDIRFVFDAHQQVAS